MKVYMHLLYFLSDLDDILYKWSVQSPAHNLWATLKSIQARPYISRGRKWNNGIAFTRVFCNLMPFLKYRTPWQKVCTLPRVTQFTILRTVLFWVIAQRIVVIPYRRFRTTYRVASARVQASYFVQYKYTDGKNYYVIITKGILLSLILFISCIFIDLNIVLMATISI